MTNDWTGHDYLSSRLARRSEGYLLDAKQRTQLRRYLLRTLPAATLNPGAPQRREAIQAAIAQALRERVLAAAFSPDPETLARLYAETVGLGPLDALLADGTVTSITANGPGLLMVERLDQSGISFAPGFESADLLLQAMDALAHRAGRALSPADPVVDLVWDDPDGASTRVHLNLLGRKSPFLALRRGRRQAFHLGDYVAGGRMNGDMAAFLTEAVRAGVSIVITGTPGSGKTALLEALLHLTSASHQGHVVLVEDDPEINVHGLSHVSAFQVPKPRPGDEAPIGFLGLVLASLRMNCRGILVCGEVRGAEAGGIIAVMPSYKAVWLTVHGTTPEDGLERLVAAAQMGGTRPPSPFSSGRQEHLVRRNLAAGLQLIVQMDRLPVLACPGGQSREPGAKVADDRIVVSGVCWLDGLSDNARDWNLTPVFEMQQQVVDGSLTVTWEAAPDFHWPADVAARLAMAELQGGGLDEAAFRAELATAQAALESNQAAEASSRLERLYSLTSGREQRRLVLRMLRQALLAQPARWQALLAAARETEARLQALARRREWAEAQQVLEITDRDPKAAVALAQMNDVETIRDRVAEGLQALDTLDRTAERAARLSGQGQHWEALALLANLPLEKLSAAAATQVASLQAEQLRVLQDRGGAGDEPDAGRVARAILRLLPATYRDLHAWATQHSPAGQPDETLSDLLPALRLTPPPEGGNGQSRIYSRACLAVAAGDTEQARDLLQQLGNDPAARRLLKTLDRQ
jgi:pilus assembly protein CpaF